MVGNSNRYVDGNKPSTQQGDDPEQPALATMPSSWRPVSLHISYWRLHPRFPLVIKLKGSCLIALCCIQAPSARDLQPHTPTVTTSPTGQSPDVALDIPPFLRQRAVCHRGAKNDKDIRCFTSGCLKQALCKHARNAIFVGATCNRYCVRSNPAQSVISAGLRLAAATLCLSVLRLISACPHLSLSSSGVCINRGDQSSKTVKSTRSRFHKQLIAVYSLQGFSRVRCQEQYQTPVDCVYKLGPTTSCLRFKCVC